MEKELGRLVPENQKFQVYKNSVEDRLFAVWSGGSILANLGPFKQMWTTKTNYEEAQK